MIDTYAITDFHKGDRVWFFHPGTVGVMYWGSVESVGRRYLRVRMAPDGRLYRIPPRDVGQIERG